ncbi:endoplasmic reticulum metallopeptidase 1-like isoform X2 [Aricia agestis]|nr:endoplasmic reticulum metallopeptidase 1-like isoform X2 [Aricia agestis]XP_041984495.1 endoplasmic reticulum metallopeptidase 1-like isoform X2 [Aricia agestis]
MVAQYADTYLPEPLDRSAPPDRFIAEIAHEHLVNLTSMGPRVAGSYENEVAAVRVLVEALRGVAAAASPHNRLDIDVMRADGAFSLTFIDGMTNMYRGVQGVVARARGAGGAAGGRPALLLNCHYDTVPDSPGASDDGAGCAVLLEVTRALVAAPRPLRHDLLLLLNGAEENILQASHAFVTTHRWARAARAFLNLEACGAGGREVLFQAGPAQPWLLELYAAAAPRPRASSLAQELFASGLVPADTDFRVFRDHGRLSGLDLAWSANGYVYHTRLDSWRAVPPAALQRTGDNVLALAAAALAGPHLAAPPESAAPPVFFDVLGVAVLVLRPPAAAAAALLALAAVALALRCSAAAARARIYVRPAEWARGMLRVTAAALLAQLAGLAAALLPALVLHAAGVRMTFYARPALLLPLSALPALAGSWADARHTSGSWARVRGAARGWAAARAWRDALALLAALALAAGLARGVRSAFVPALWTLPAVGALAADALGAGEGGAALAAAAGALLPAATSAYLAVGTLDMFVPIMGRAGTSPLPPDVLMALCTGALTLLTCSWLLPLVVAARRARALVLALAAVGAAATLAVLLARPAPYSAERPQRLMVFHTRRSAHAAAANVTQESAADAELLYWVPELDVNTPHSLDDYVAGMREAHATTAAECARWVYCGAPYFLPVLSLVARGHALPAPHPPRPRLAFAARLLPPAPAAPRERALELRLAGAPHLTAVLAPAAGVALACAAPAPPLQPGPRWGDRDTYFVALYAAPEPAPEPWVLRCTLSGTPAGGEWLQAALAAHGMADAARRSPHHESLLRSAPDWVAPTGWGVDLHLVTLQ